MQKVYATEQCILALETNKHKNATAESQASASQKTKKTKGQKSEPGSKFEASCRHKNNCQLFPLVANQNTKFTTNRSLQCNFAASKNQFLLPSWGKLYCVLEAIKIYGMISLPMQQEQCECFDPNGNSSLSSPTIVRPCVTRNYNNL